MNGVSTNIALCLALAVMAAGTPTAFAEETRPFTSPPGARVVEQGWFAPARVKVRAMPKSVTRAFVIPIRKDMTERTSRSIRSKLEYCRQQQAELIVLDMDCTGGSPKAGLELAGVLKKLRMDMPRARTVCFVRTLALGSGAVVALACEEIVMTSVGKLGGGTLFPNKLRSNDLERLESILRLDYAESAALNGYNVPLAEKMASLGREVWLIRHKQTRELRYVRAMDRRGRVDILPGVAQGVSAPDSQWKLLRVVAPKGETLTMLPAQAREYGFAARIIKASSEKQLALLMRQYNVSGKPVVLKGALPPTTNAAAKSPAKSSAEPTARAAHPDGWFAPPRPTGRHRSAGSFFRRTTVPRSQTRASEADRVGGASARRPSLARQRTRTPERPGAGSHTRRGSGDRSREPPGGASQSFRRCWGGHQFLPTPRGGSAARGCGGGPDSPGPDPD